MMEDVDHYGIPQKRKSTEQVNMKTTFVLLAVSWRGGHFQDD